MKRQTGSSRLHLVSSMTEETLVARSEQRLHSIVSTLKECRTALVASSDAETAQLLSMAILQLQMKLNRIADSELRAFCEALTPADAPVKQAQRSKSAPGPRQRAAAVLKLVE